MLQARRYIAPAGNAPAPDDERTADLLAALAHASADDATQAALLALLECQASPTLWAHRAERVTVARKLAACVYREAPCAPGEAVFAGPRGSIDPQTRYEDDGGYIVGNPWRVRWDQAAYARALGMNPANNRNHGSAGNPQHRRWRVTCRRPCPASDDDYACDAPVRIRQTKARRQCALKGCRTLAPAKATKRWRYCSTRHATAARMRRMRHTRT
jgi:hypothetical protein